MAAPERGVIGPGGELPRGAERLLALHARTLPQRDDLCGAFCAALALGAAGVTAADGRPFDQDAVARAAGTVVSAEPDRAALPPGESGRRDYRLELPTVADPARSGTTAAGLVAAITTLSAGAVVAVPLRGSWTRDTVDGLIGLACASERPVALIANVATRRLWGARPEPHAVARYLGTGDDGGGPPPDWDVGHFVCVVGAVRGPRGVLAVIADTYRSLGREGVHRQPLERLADALERPGMTPGGVLAVADARDAAGVAATGRALGLAAELWDNGSVRAETPARHATDPLV